MKKIVIAVVIIVMGLVIFDKWLSHNDKIRKRNREKNPIYALRRESVTDEQLNQYSSAGELQLYPYLMFKGRSDFKSPTLNTNSDGFRAPEISDKKQGTYRIIVIGGSTAFGGMSTNDEKTFFNIMQRKLNENAKAGQRFEVISAGVPSYNSMQELILLESKLLKYQPDMVIVLDGFNDAINYLIRDNRSGYPSMFKDMEKYVDTKSFFMMRLRKIRIARKLMERIEANSVANQKTFDPAVVNFYGHNLDVMCHLLDSYGIIPIIVLQPALDYKKPLSALERQYLESDKTMSHAVFVKLYNSMANMAKDIAFKNKVSYIDARYIFNGDEGTLFMDDCHLNDRAQEILANILLEKINKEIRPENKI